MGLGIGLGLGLRGRVLPLVGVRVGVRVGVVGCSPVPKAMPGCRVSAGSDGEIPRSAAISEGGGCQGKRMSRLPGMTMGAQFACTSLTQSVATWVRVRVRVRARVNRP